MRSQVRLVAWCSFGLCTPLLLPLLTGRVFTLNDLGTYHIPLRYLYREALRAGNLLVWSPALHSGLYLFGEGEAGMAHPFHLLLYRFLSLAAAMNIEIISGYVAAAAGTFVFFRRLGLSREGASFGAMVFAFSGFNLLHVVHVNAVEIIAHAPWILLGTHVLLTSEIPRSRIRAFVGIALLIGSQLLLGYPQYVWLTFVGVGFLVICLVVDGVRPARVLPLAGAIVLGSIIGSIQVLPTVEALTESMRSATTSGFRMTFSLNPLNLVQFVSPYAFRDRIYAHPDAFQVHESSVYNGAFCTVAFSWLTVRYRMMARRRLVFALVALAVVSLVLALGRYGIIYPLLAQMPGVNVFRAPARHIVLLHFAFSGIAALTFEDMVGLIRSGNIIDRIRLWPLLVPIVLSTTVTAIVVFSARGSWADAHGLHFSGVMQAGPWSALVVVTAVLFILAARGVQWSIPILVMVGAFDLGLWGYSYIYAAPVETISALTDGVSVPSLAKRGDLLAPQPVGRQENLVVLRELRVSPGYVALVPASTLKPTDPIAQRLAGVTWRGSSGQWAAVRDSMPRVRLLSRGETSSNIPADLARIDIASVALVDEPVPELFGAPGRAVIVTERPGHMLVDVTAEGRQLLVTTERFHPGWRVTQDGHLSQAIRVYGDFLGTVVNPATHQVAFTFAPAGMRNGLRLTVAGLAVTFTGALVMWRKTAREHVRGSRYVVKYSA